MTEPVDTTESLHFLSSAPVRLCRTDCCQSVSPAFESDTRVGDREASADTCRGIVRVRTSEARSITMPVTLGVELDPPLILNRESVCHAPSNQALAS